MIAVSLQHTVQFKSACPNSEAVRRLQQAGKDPESSTDDLTSISNARGGKGGGERWTGVRFYPRKGTDT